MAFPTQWMCRRSLLELDELFSNFYQKHYQSLSEQEVQDFHELLMLEDAEIMAMIVSNEQPAILKRVLSLHLK